MGDAGLFGPESVTWRVHSDPVVALGGLRALLLQALHPVVMAGVAAHSDFQADPWGRLLRTIGYVETVSFGTVAAAERAGARVRGMHRPLHGVDEHTGRAYRVDDPDLLCWVHCCLVDSFLETYQRAGGGLTAAQADTYVREQVRAARLVGLRDADVPGSAGELRAYFEDLRPTLVATPAAKEAARFVVVPPMPARWLEPARPLWLYAAGTAFALLPRWARRCYGLPGLPTTDLSATVSVRALRASLLLVPQTVRESPIVRDARARAAGLPPRAGTQKLRRRVVRLTQPRSDLDASSTG